MTFLPYVMLSSLSLSLPVACQVLQKHRKAGWEKPLGISSPASHSNWEYCQRLEVIRDV